MTAAGVHVGGTPATSYRKFLRMSCPCGVWTTSGWNWTPYSRRPRSSNAAIGVDGDDAVTTAPAGGAVTESRWLIQTVCSGGRSWKSSDSAASSSVLPNSETPVRSTAPPRSRAMSCIP